MQVWNVLRAARWKCSTQKIAKKLPSGHHPTTLSGYVFAIKAHINNRKKLVNHYLPHMSPQYGELWPTSDWDWSGSLGATLQISTGFASWQPYCMALEYWALATLCGVEQRAPTIFGRSAITFGIGPHSSFYWSVNSTVMCDDGDNEYMLFMKITVSRHIKCSYSAK